MNKFKFESNLSKLDLSSARQTFIEFELNFAKNLNERITTFKNSTRFGSFAALIPG